MLYPSVRWPISNIFLTAGVHLTYPCLSAPGCSLGVGKGEVVLLVYLQCITVLRACVVISVVCEIVRALQLHEVGLAGDGTTHRQIL